MIYLLELFTFPHTFRINSLISKKNGKRKKERGSMGITVIALGAQKMELGTFFLTTVLISRTNVKGLKQFNKN